MLALALIGIVAAYFFGNILLQFVRNKNAHRSFQNNSQNLPILPDPNIFSGHIFKTTYNKNNFKLVQELHKTYGKTFGFFMCGQPWVATTDLDLIKLVMIDEAYKHNDRAVMGVPYKEFNDSIFQVNGDKWRRARRVVAPTMTNHKVRGDAVSADMENIIEQLAEAFADRFRASPRSDNSFEIDALHMAKCYALAVLLLVAYNQNNVVDFKKERDAWIDRFTEAEEIVTNPLCAISMMFPFMQPLSNQLFKFHALSKHIARIMGFINSGLRMNLERERFEREDDTDADDDLEESKKTKQRRLLDEILESYKNRQLSYDELKGTLFFFFIAGFETAAATVTNLIWQLAQHQDIQDKLRADVTKEGLDSPYLFACISEALRWHPPVPMGIGRIVSCDLEHKNQVIPKGSFIMPSIYSVHHDPDVWPDPESFDPERWMKQTDMHPAAFMAFGLGLRNCTGGKLAMHEMKLLFQMIITDYRIEKCESTPTEYNFTSPAMLMTIPDEPVIVRLVPI